jgi:hypothetical protein
MKEGMEETIDFDAMLTSAGRTPAQLKRDLPIAYVLDREGVKVSAGDGRLVAICPFHDDHDPSFDIYGEHLERWGCRPCGIGGDVVDLIRHFGPETTHARCLDRANKMLAQMPEDWKAPVVEIRPKVIFDADAAQRLVDRALSDLTGVEAWLIDAAVRRPGLRDISAEWLRANFKVGSDGERIIVPLWNRDGDLVAYKHRTPTTDLRSAAGSRLVGSLYGEWRDTNSSDVVVLVEGESDTWAAAFALPDGYVALGLAAGAGAHPHAAPSLAGREVIIAFDGDNAGRRAAMDWAKALRAEGCDVQVSPLPDGYDVAGIENPEPYLTLSRPMLTPPEGIMVQDGIFVRPTAESEIPLSNWSLRPKAELLSDDGQSAYECEMVPSRRMVTISSIDMSSKARMVDWSARSGGAWYGADRDGQQLLGMLQSSGPFLVPGRMTTIAGLHGNHFVMPGETIGPDLWRYVPPAMSIQLHQKIKTAPGDWNPAQIHTLRRLHRHDIMDPILAWMAIAPLRSIMPQFPILAVTGSSGSGKTTLLETVLEAFTGSLITTNLTSTTAHALFAFVGSTNAFPVWFDEYRPGARSDTLESLRQTLRDAYTGQSSSKGGMGGHWSEVTTVAANAPIIVSGEDAFSETSHTERMILVDLPNRDKGAAALEDVLRWGPTGLSHGYLTWLQRMLLYEQLYLTPEPSGPKGLPSRNRYNFGVLDLGWTILNEFVQMHNGEALGAPDWSRITGSSETASQHNPIKDALIWCLDEDRIIDSVWHDADKGLVHVRVRNFVNYVGRNGFLLPGGEEAVRRYLVENYKAYGNKPVQPGTKRQVRAHTLLHSDLVGSEA